ncbi:hypothetical protein C8J38_105123 [Rhizobium sp. PP-WC-2G-219]|nr:hypothetical protein C8J38_105123 [Rhizobium sp. PP-WC-2G-219]
MPEVATSDAAVRAAFRSQSVSCRALGSPFVATLCDLAAERLTATHPVGRHILGWTGDPSSSADSVPLRFAGSLYALVLDGADPALAEAYPPHATDPDGLWDAVERACREHAEAILARLASPPQTNEVRRSAALLPGFLTIAKRFDKPLYLSEVGASAGLNLLWDRYAYRLGDFAWGDPQSPVMLAPTWTGGPPPDASLIVRDRAGCDLRPLDPAHPDDAERLLSYLWADQADRVERTRAALHLAALSGLKVEAADAVDWLERRLAVTRPGCVHVITHTIAWQYLPAEARERGEALIETAGRAATEGAPLAHLSLEGDGREPGAALTLQMWPTGARHEIGRADFHGRWVDWRGWPDVS